MASIGVFCASSQRLEQRWLDLAHDLGVEIGRRGHELVSGGGCVGMMGALVDGAREGGARTYGVIPQNLVDREVADTKSDELVVTDGLASRKTLMIERADAFITLPGGLGTLDELFEVWTTATLDLHRKPLLLFDVDGFYGGLLEWLRGLARQEFVRASAMAMLLISGDVGESLDLVEASLLGAAADRA
ncbi:TIGR00730 family Rossman fold protein [Dactylosporangium sp. CA-233914]|uniref:LOG family protein n=1 Tax=Dactylosporangium sp. CA-233914 TaxID=3239934 RepID=UPI003D92B8DD